MAIEIIGTGRAVPLKKVANGDLPESLDTSDEWIRSHTGIGSRHVSDDSTATSDIALEAAKKALAMAAGYEGDDPDRIEAAALAEAKTIGAIVLGTATPDFPGSPSTACLVQRGLGAQGSWAMDVSAACTGFLAALETSAGLLQRSQGWKRALVIGAETLSKVLDWTDRGSCVLFGDGAGAVVIEKTDAPSEGPGRRGLSRSILRADGSGAESIIFRRGGSRAPFKPGEVVEKGVCAEINGQEVYNFAVGVACDVISELLAAEGMGADDLAWIVPHQANARIIQAAARRLKIPAEKFFLNIEEYANTSAASIPIALDELWRARRISRGDAILTVGFGGGLTYGGNVIIW
ncbi:MAG: beta-ketoacyl-ACP synthase 3 [Treponema sp.]|nr:beta-ketoacyl-ACP synthase 3 [Treponema sp.]